MPDETPKKNKIYKWFDFITVTIISIISISVFTSFFLPRYAIIKYGSSPTPFDRRLLKYFKISGKVKLKSSNMPVSDQKIKLVAMGLETVTNKNGDFLFEIYNANENEFKIEIPGTIPMVGTKTYEVKFAAKSQVSNNIEAQEATLEILL